MDLLLDSLDPEKWQTVDVSQKGDGYKEYNVMRQSKEDPKGTLKLYLLEGEEMKTPILEGCKPGHNPLKNVGKCEIKLDGDEKVIGIDVEGDMVVKK